MRRPLALLFLVALVAALAGPVPPAAHAALGACVVGQPVLGCEVWTGRVSFVGDGDTIYVDVDDDGIGASHRIRISGIQAMEQSVYAPRSRQGDCHAVEATERLEQLIRRARGRVRLSAEDPDSRSRGRFMRTVAVKVRGGWRDVGATMLREGLALWWPTWTEPAPNRYYSARAQEAIGLQRALFAPGACGVGPSAGSPLKLWVNWDADGDDSANPSGEWVKIRNLDPVYAVGLGGWHLRDSLSRRYTFPDYAGIAPGATVTVNVGQVGDTQVGDQTVFGCCLRNPVFERATDDEDAMGDGAYLFDTLGNVRASMVYPCRRLCADPLQSAVSLAADPLGRREAITIANLTGAPLELDGYVLKSAPESYHFAPGSVLPPGGSMRIQVTGQPEEDAPLDRSWGLANPILRDAGDVVKLLTYTDITLACAAWGDRVC